MPSKIIDNSVFDHMDEVDFSSRIVEILSRRTRMQLVLLSKRNAMYKCYILLVPVQNHMHTAFDNSIWIQPALNLKKPWTS